MQTKVTLLDGSLFTCTVEVRQVETGGVSQMGASETGGGETGGGSQVETDETGGGNQLEAGKTGGDRWRSDRWRGEGVRRVCLWTLRLLRK